MKKMNFDAVLVSFKVDGSEKTNETSGVLFNKNTVLITGTSLLPLVGQEKWMSLLVGSSSSEFKANEYIKGLFFRVFFEPRNNNESDKVNKKLCSFESEAIGVWKCPVVAESLKNLFQDWTLGHGNLEYESEVFSSDDIALSKELMSVFVLLKCKSEEEPDQTKEKHKSGDSIRGLSNLLLNLQIPSRGQEVEIVSTPFGNEHFMNSLTRGLICNVVGYEKCIILSDARTVSGCEGGPIFFNQCPGKSMGGRKLLGVVSCPLTWCRGEWVGFTIGISLLPVLKNLLRAEAVGICSRMPGGNPLEIYNSDLLPLDFIDDIVVLVRSKTSWGSGVILNAGLGIIVTCSHVVKDSEKVYVFQKGNKYSAEIVFKSQDDTAFDLAIIKTGAKFVFKKEAKFSENPARAGETVVAAGFPFFSEKDEACIRPSIATGCVARVNPYMIQTTCCIQSGFSGGGLFRNDQLLGIIISNVKHSTAGALFPRINFIVPSSVFKQHIFQYIKTNDVGKLRDLECSSKKVQALWRLEPSKL